MQNKEDRKIKEETKEATDKLLYEFISLQREFFRLRTRRHDELRAEE